MNKTALIKASFPSAVIGTILCVGTFLMFYTFELSWYDLAFKMVYIIPLPFIFVALWFYKKSNRNELRVWEGFLLGGSVNIPILILYSLFIFIFMQYIDVEFLASSGERHIALIKERMESGVLQNKEKAEEASELLKNLEVNVRSTSAKDFMLSEIIWMSIFGSVFTLILSIVLRK